MTVQVVGFTSGHVAGIYQKDKAKRESLFPLGLVDKGIQFACMTAKASMPADEDRIKEQIEGSSKQLDAMLHNVVAMASAALQRALAETTLKDQEDIDRTEKYLEAMRLGKMHTIDIRLNNSAVGTDEWLNYLR